MTSEADPDGLDSSLVPLSEVCCPMMSLAAEFAMPIPLLRMPPKAGSEEVWGLSVGSESWRPILAVLIMEDDEVGEQELTGTPGKED